MAKKLSLIHRKKTFTVQIDGELPKGIKPAVIRVEPETGTYVFFDRNENVLGTGQFNRMSK